MLPRYRPLPGDVCPESDLQDVDEICPKSTVYFALKTVLHLFAIVGPDHCNLTISNFTSAAEYAMIGLR